MFPLGWNGGMMGTTQYSNIPSFLLEAVRPFAISQLSLQRFDQLQHNDNPHKVRLPSFQHSIVPSFHHSTLPSFHCSFIPSFHFEIFTLSYPLFAIRCLFPPEPLFFFQPD